MSLQSAYDVDLALICHYSLSSDRRKMLPFAMIWEDATPLGYAVEHSTNYIQPITRGLARQHRFIIKDQLLNYDLFINFEDDMVIKKSAVNYFWETSMQIQREQSQARSNLLDYYGAVEMKRHFYGELTKHQWERLIPGWIRVEAALPKFKQRHRSTDKVVDWETSCCHLHLENTNERRSESVPTRDLLYWETDIAALGVRQLPTIGWSALQAGTREDYYSDPNYIVGRFGGEETGNSNWLNNQGGWMGTAAQIHMWHSKLCRMPFLPPLGFDDGLGSQSVEYWSGGISLVGVNSCNLQRIIPMSSFGDALLYHASNNKQGQAVVQARSPSRTIVDLYRQLKHLISDAERKKQEEIEDMA